MPATTLIIFNPKSGILYAKNYRQNFLKQYLSQAPGEACFWLELTPAPLSEDLQAYDFTGCGKIVVIGGDGTIKSVASYLINHNLNIPLAIIPQGSANILAVSLHIPLLPKAAIKTAALGRPIKMDVALLNKQEYFLVGLSVGLVSEILAKTNKNAKKYLGGLAYLAAIFKNTKINGSEFKITLDGKVFTVTGNSLIIANALSFYKLKPAFAPDFNDGWLNVIVVKNKTLLGFLAAIIFLLFKFKNKEEQTWFGFKAKEIIFLKTAKKIIIEQTDQGGKTNAAQMDGDLLPDTGKLAIEILPSKLTVLTLKTATNT